MTRDNTVALENSSLGPSSKVRVTRSSGSGKKLSREALKLLTTNLISDVDASIPAAEILHRRHTVPSPGPAQPIACPTKGPSEEPALDQEKKDLSGNKKAKDASLIVGGVQTNKRSTATGSEVPVHDGSEARRHKKVKSLKHQVQETRSFSAAEAGAISATQESPRHKSDPTGAKTDIDPNVHPVEDKHNSKASRASKIKDRPIMDAKEQGVPTCSMNVADVSAAAQPVDTSAREKKRQNEKKNRAAAASDSMTNPTGAKETGAEKTRGTSDRVDAITTLQVAVRPEIVAPTAAIAPAKGSQRQSVPAAPGALPVETRQEVTAAEPSADAAYTTDPATSCGLQKPSKGSGSKAAQPAATLLNAEDGTRELPATGTTPVKALLHVPLPRLDEIGQQERRALVETQRQLSELRALYDELKATKVQQVETVLAEQVEYAEERVRNAEQLAQHWQDVAERAEANAKAAGTEEVEGRIDTLEREAVQLLKQNGDLLLRVACLERELSQTQQVLFDARAELLRFETVPTDGPDSQAEDGANCKGADPAEQHQADVAGPEDDKTPADSREHRTSSEVEDQGPASPITFRGAFLPLVKDAAAADNRSAGDHPSLGRSLGIKFPSPGGGVQMSSPSVQVCRTQDPDMVSGSGGRSARHGLRTECQRVVQLLQSIRYWATAPSPSIQSDQLHGALPRTLQGELDYDANAGNGSSERGVSTECQRIIEMLPGLRQPSPSIESRLASGAPLGMQADVLLTVRDDPGGAASRAEARLNAQGESSKRRSDGSPINGICGSAKRNAAGASALEGSSHAHSMRAPEALGPPVQRQGQYSFVDLNPASARKAARIELVAGTGILSTPAAVVTVTEPGNKDDVDKGVQQAGPVRSAAALVAAAAAKALPPSSAVQQLLLQRFYPREVSPETVAMATAAIIDSGSVVSNQDSCNLPKLVARAMVQMQDTQPLTDVMEKDSLPQACGNQSLVSATKPPALLPPQSMGPGRVDDAELQADVDNNVPQRRQTPKKAFSSTPSPRTAKLKFYERLLEWHVDVISTKPLEAFRMTHTVCGMSFEIRQVEVDDEELMEDAEGADQRSAAPECGAAAAMKYYEYIPLTLGIVGELLPDFLKETIVFPEDQRPKLLERLEVAIKETRSKKP